MTRMKIVSFLCVLLLCLAALPARAQDAPTGEAFVRQVAPSTEPVSREAALQLVGDRLAPQEKSLLNSYLHAGAPGGGHFAVIRQDGAAGLALIEQEGASNLAVMIQQGTGNTMRLTQHGTGNIYGAWLDGNDNRLHVAQHGDANTYLIAFDGDGPGFEHRVVQFGTGNQVVQLGAGASPFGVEQRCDGMTLIIRHDTP